MLRIHPPSAVRAVFIAALLVLTACSSGPPATAPDPTTTTPATVATTPPRPPPAGSAHGDRGDAFRMMVDPDGTMTATDAALAMRLGEAVCEQARAAGGGEALAARWRVDADRAAAGELAGLDVVLMIGLALPAGTALCSDQRAVIEAALVELGLPRDAIDGRDTARSRGP